MKTSVLNFKKAVPFETAKEFVMLASAMNLNVQDMSRFVLLAAGFDPVTGGPEWAGVLAFEGQETGDGREFAPGSLTWDTPPLPLTWQPVSEPEHGGAVLVGLITSIERRGDMIWGEGVFDHGSEAGEEAFRLMGGPDENGVCGEQFLKGVSVDVDSVKDSDVELIQAADGEPTDLFGPPPELTIFHAGRIRGACLLPLPAFSGAELHLIDTASEPATGAPGMYGLEFGALSDAGAAAQDGAWDAAAVEARVKSPADKAYFSKIYAYFKDGEDDTVKSSFSYPHHAVAEDGTPGAPNATACSAGIAALNGGRGGTTIPESEKAGVHAHLARHLSAAGKTPPELTSLDDVLVAAAYSVTIPDLPPAWWFDEPTDVELDGALTVTDDGRVFGLLAPAKTRHISPQFKGRTVPLGVDYSRFHRGSTICEGGERIVTGNLTMECGHDNNLAHNGDQAMTHYDNSCSLAARIRCGESDGKAWVAGALMPGVTPEQLVRMMACQASGDWRPSPKGGIELAAALLVPVPGFPMARRTASVRYKEGVLVASAVPVRFESMHPARPTIHAGREIADRIASSVGRSRRTIASELAAKVRSR